MGKIIEPLGRYISEEDSIEQALFRQQALKIKNFVPLPVGGLLKRKEWCDGISHFKVAKQIYQLYAANAGYPFAVDKDDVSYNLVALSFNTIGRLDLEAMTLGMKLAELDGILKPMTGFELNGCPFGGNLTYTRRAVKQYSTVLGSGDYRRIPGVRAPTSKIYLDGEEFRLPSSLEPRSFAIKGKKKFGVLALIAKQLVEMA